MVAYVIAFVALSMICNAALMAMVKRAPVLEGRPRVRMMPAQYHQINVTPSGTHA